MNRRELVQATLLSALDVAVLTSAHPDLPRLTRRLAHPHTWVAEVGADAALTELASAALWFAAAWLAMGLLVVAGTALPGCGGHLARRVSRLVLPAAVYRLTVGVAGIGIALAPTVAEAAAVEPAVGAPAAASTVSAASSAATSVTTPAAKPPPPVWPTDTTRAAPKPGPTARQRSPTASVVVQRGDSLWSISREHLPAAASAARIVGTWPRWYAANRRTIGSDPDLLLPGQVLHAPSDSAPAEEN